MPNIQVGILFGGKSTEHEVSLQSAKNIVNAIDREKYEVTLIGIDKTGGWHVHTEAEFRRLQTDPAAVSLSQIGQAVALRPGQPAGAVWVAAAEQPLPTLDVVFPVLHGQYGEDGTVQGLLKLMDLPFVGPGVLGSALAMDKDMTKRVLRDAGIPVARWRSYAYGQRADIDFADVSGELGLPLFIKPANAGSSVGVSKVQDRDGFYRAIGEAFQFDNKLLIEESIVGRELECAVLGNEQPQASAVGEIIAQRDFYSYEAKYKDENGAILCIPAQVTDETKREIQTIAVKTFQALACEGMSRVDCFLTAAGRVLVNEVNTIPGFTAISMYPKLWDISGVAYADLIDRLIQLAIERHQREQRLQTGI